MLAAMSQQFTTDRASFEQLVARWRTFAREFVERSRTQDWEYRVPLEFVGEKPVIAHRAGHAAVLDLQSQSKRKFLQVVQFESEDLHARATAWMQKFGDPTEPKEVVDLLRVNCSGTNSELPDLSLVFAEFIVNDASAHRMEELIHSLGIDPTD